MTEIDVSRQPKAKQYARLQRQMMLVDLLVGVVLLFCWLLFGWASQLRDVLLGFTTHAWLVVAGVGLVFGGSFFLVGLPISVYADYILPHRYEISTQSRRSWISDQVKSLLISGLIGGVLLELVYWLLRRAPQTWWLWMAGFMLVFIVLMVNLAPVLIMPLFYKYKPLGEEHAGLREMLLRLAEQAGVKVKGVYKVEMSSRTKAANAMVMGLGNTRRIVLFDTLISEFSADEIETIMAHELGHQVHKDIGFSILVEGGSITIGLYLAALGLQAGAARLGLSGVADVAGMPLLALVFGAFGLVTLPLTNGFSRWRERMADQFALKQTGKGAAFASAFSRLANQNLAEVDPSPWVEFLLYSHPPLNKRIQMALETAPVSAQGEETRQINAGQH
jgi:STE24 endopeptidase